MKASDYVNVFKYHGKGLYALNRVWDTFKDVHLFDLKRGTDTAKIKTDGYTDSRYMIYMPVYTTVCLEMIRKSFEWYTSGIRYSNTSLIPVFVDLGAGAGKAAPIATPSAIHTGSLVAAKTAAPIAVPTPIQFPPSLELLNFYSY
jgi:hypothetical protein